VDKIYQLLCIAGFALGFYLLLHIVIYAYTARLLLKANKIKEYQFSKQHGYPPLEIDKKIQMEKEKILRQAEKNKLAAMEKKHLEKREPHLTKMQIMDQAEEVARGPRKKSED